MRHLVKFSTISHWRCDRTAMVLLVSTAAACLLAVVSPGDASAAFLPPMMTANALFLMNSSHHQRRPPSSRAPGSGPSVSTSPQHESNTKRRRRESRSGSPLIVFYGMVLGRPGFGTESEKAEQTSESSETKLSSKGKTSNNNKFDDDFFSKDMIQRKQEFRQRYENFRGRGRWGGYSLVAMPQETYTRSPLPVVSTTTSSTTAKTTTSTTSVAETVTKSMKERQQRQRVRRAPSMMQITDIQQYKDEVVDATDASLVVVRFYASWCKACKAIEISYHRLPQEFPSNVKFVEVPLTKENAYLHKGLGVPSLPFAHVYYRDDNVDNNGTGETPAPCRLVDEVKINKTKFSEFKRIIRSYVTKECDVHYHSGTNSTDENNEDTIMVTPSSQRPQAIADVTEEENEAIPVL